MRSPHNLVPWESSYEGLLNLYYLFLLCILFERYFLAVLHTQLNASPPVLFVV